MEREPPNPNPSKNLFQFFTSEGMHVHLKYDKNQRKTVTTQIAEKTTHKPHGKKCHNESSAAKQILKFEKNNQYSMYKNKTSSECSKTKLAVIKA